MIQVVVSMPKPKIITLTFEDILGQPYKLQGRIVGTKTRGFDLPSGAWSFFPGPGCTPAKFRDLYR